jgi:antitoxin PrlF
VLPLHRVGFLTGGKVPTATVTSKGQVTLPRKIREALRIRPGDRVDFVLDENGEVRVRAGDQDVSALRGLLRRPDRPKVALEAMEEAIARRGEKP